MNRQQMIARIVRELRAGGDGRLSNDQLRMLVRLLQLKRDEARSHRDPIVWDLIAKALELAEAESEEPGISGPEPSQAGDGQDAVADLFN